MRLAELIGAPGAADVEIAGLAHDSRRVRPGDLFFCVPGEHSDGHDFAAQAVREGAAALAVERPLGLGVPEVLLPSVRAAMGPVAATFYGDPTTRLRVVGVTGTNGKTTTAFLVRALLEATGTHCGLLGTITSVVGGVERPVMRTTPEAIDLQRDFRAMLDSGESACAMEVSSHAVELARTESVHFAAAIFTNLTQDHLDFHGSMERYFQAKRRLFMPESGGSRYRPSDWELRGARPKPGDTRMRRESPYRPAGLRPAAPPSIAVVNIDDPYGQRLAAELPDPLTFALTREADYRARDVRMDFNGCRFTVDTPEGERAVALPLPGRFNVSNALAALAATHALGFDLDTLVAALARGVRVPGRFEPVREGQDFSVLVDYAHTPDSLENVLRAARELAQGRVVCVFGAGGDRDRGKRPLMGEIAARLADVAVVTSDNPRSEAPEAIVAGIVAGIDASAVSAEAVQVEVDRRAAIGRAIALARPDDVVVIAGKGHEQGQEFAGGRKLSFDDVTVAREALRARREQAAGATA